MLSMLLVFGCSDYLDINTSPNNPADADAQLVIPAAQQSIASRVGNSYRITGSIWSQHYTQNNSSSQYIAIDNYDVSNLNFHEADFIELYSGALNDLKFVKDKSKATGNWTNYLIAQVLEAYAYQFIVDFYDGAPVTEALQGGQSNFTPHWDEGEVVYDTLLARLDYALSKDFDNLNNVNPGSNDLLFDGNVDKWTRFANSLKLKLMMRFSHADPTKATALISALVNSGAVFLQEDASINRYYDEPDRGNPLYESDRRNLNTKTNLKASTTLVNFLQINSDPRLDPFFLTPTAGGAIKGMRQGTSSTPGAELNSQTVSEAEILAEDPVYFISLAESFFLRAEAAARGFSNEDAKALYDAGVLAAFARYGLDGSSFIAAGGNYEFPTAGSVEEQVEAIIEQKWVAQVGGNSIEAWFDMLRTGYPSFSDSAPGEAGYDPTAPGAPIFAFPVDAVTANGQYPIRLLIPEDEILNNPNAPEQPAGGIFEPVWWDVN